MRPSAWMVGLLIGLVRSGPATWAGEGARIVKVLHQIQESRRGSPALLTERLKPARQDAGAERFLVYWEAGERGLSPGAVVTFEFRQAYSPLVRTLFIQYPFPVKGERCATFEVTEPTIRRGGRVVAWRARVVRGGRRLGEKTSSSWSQAP